MSYVDKVRDHADLIRSSAPPGAIGQPQRLMADMYEEEYLKYAKDADAFDPAKDNVQLLWESITLHKRQDITGESEIYLTIVVGDNGRKKDDPEVFILDHYRQMKKDEIWDLRDPKVVYDGNPKGVLDYQVNVYDTKNDNHDNTVKAVRDIINGAAAAVGSLAPGIGTAIGAGVALVNTAVTEAALKHGDELVDNFPGSLKENDTSDVGPYSLASPRIYLKTDDVTVKLKVVRDANARGASRKRNNKKPTLVRSSPREVAIGLQPIRI